jgi:uncharacterized protein (DUF362 family)
MSQPANEKSFVVISHARPIDYLQDYASLPAEYGTPAYDLREDVQAIQAAVFDSLSQLDERTHFSRKLAGKKVVIKPNLVSVFHRLGMTNEDSPESTDPRVIDAVVKFIQQFTRRITIVESSGRGMPTMSAFRVSGIDRLARYRGAELLALEEQPTDRYLLPKAKVMKEIVVPRIFSEIIRGEAFYISIPKMKTNLYTGVTLGFKNAMGTITYNLRQRNHNYAIDQKLVDMLHLFKPDLVVIDGIVGGEGDCPAPVDPVNSRVILCGNQAVETDRVATRMMGFDPDSIALMRIADECGFNDPDVTVIGEETVTPFRPADPSLTGEWMRRNFPNVKVLIGHQKNNAPLPAADGRMTESQVCALEGVCRGGCLATTRFGFSMIYSEGHKRDFSMTLILGAGVMQNGTIYYYDHAGTPYSLADIRAIKGKKLAVGTCTRELKGMVDRHVDGCMPFPNSPHQAIHLMNGQLCYVMSPRNRYLFITLLDTLQVCRKRKAHYRSGLRLDIPLEAVDKIFVPRVFTEEEMQKEYIYEPFEPLTRPQIKELCKQENRAILATFKP